MQAASNTYKEIMRRKWRNPLSHLRVTIGLINQEAQASAYIPDPDQYTYFSDLKKPMDNYKVQELYCTCDEDYAQVDGSMYFLPHEADAVVLNQGLVTEELLGDIEIRFPVQYDIKGLTVEFGKAYSVDFSIVSDNHTVEVTGNADGHYVTEEIFEGATFLRFSPSRMVNGQSRFRINQITMGIGIYFDSRKILSATKKEHISPISEELPTIDFSLTVSNKDRAFDVENDESSVNFFELGQDIEALYGQELDDGTIEWIPGINLALKEWSADDEKLNLSASDRFDSMDSTYYRGQYHPEGISLYDLAVDVFTDAGIDPREYGVDTYLKTVIVRNPIPVVAHKEALQLIANAGRCILYQDRAGKIYLKSSFVPEMSASSGDEAYFSHVSTILSKDAGTRDEYALTGQDYSTTGSTMYFLPRQSDGGTYLNTGYVSDLAADEKGAFQNNPTVTLTMEAAYKCFGVTLMFGHNWPDTAIFHSYNSGELQEDYEVRGLEQTAVIGHEFPEFDQLVIEFTKGAPNNRVILDQIAFGDSTDYVMEYGVELTKTPEGTKLARVKELQVLRTMYSQGNGEVQELIRETISLTAQDNRYTFYFSNPSYDLWAEIPERVEVSNIIQNGSFDEGISGWRNGQYDAARKCAYVVATGNSAVVMDQPVQMISGHKYYLRGSFMREEEPDAYSGNDEYDLTCKGAPESFNINVRPEVFPSDGMWHTRSVIDTVSVTGEWMVRVYTYAGKKLFADSLLLIDLTEAWGEGREPDLEWCDKYIEYFSGNASIPKYGCEIIESSAYYATVALEGVAETAEVVISGKEYAVTQARVIRQLNPTGSSETWENPLVSDVVHAADLADWIGDYFKADREYNLQYRGEPRIDANDIAFLENKYVPDLLIRVTDHTLKYNGALSGTIKARRDMSYVATAKNRLAGK